MIEHSGNNVSDFARCKALYPQALGASGYRLLAAFPAAVTGRLDVAGLGEPPTPDFRIAAGEVDPPRVYIALHVPNRALVDRFHAAALEAGGRDNGAPGPRPHYHANDDGAFVLDPDGHHLETVCREPA